ncbi:hypothetical protein GCM10029964_027020 [Kibdelosporangium lantanae]
MAVTDTPIYDQLRLELSSRREPQETAAPPRPRARTAEKPARQAPAESSSTDGQPVSVWTLVNANRRRKN